MNKVECSLLRFLVGFIENYSKDLSEDEEIIKKMLRDKRVQKLIVECMFGLEPILLQKIVKVKSGKKLVCEQEPRLAVLAKDIQNSMKNFKSIKEKLASVNGIVESIDTNLNRKIVVGEEINVKEGKSDLVNFLESMSKTQLLHQSEFEEYSNDGWTAYLEGEKILKGEVFGYQAKVSVLENKNFAKMSQLKLKTGEKIQRLESELENQRSEEIIQTSRMKMIIEDKDALELRKLSFEENMLSESANFFLIPDLPTAADKIKRLLTVRQILEKKRQQDEKIIQGLNMKLGILAQEYVDSQDKLMKTTLNFSSVYVCLLKVIENSAFGETEKSEILELLNCFECKAIENLFDKERFLEYITGKVYLNRIVRVLQESSEKNEQLTRKILKCFEGVREDQATKRVSIKDKKSKKSPNSKIKTSRNISPFKVPLIEPQSPFDSVKKLVVDLSQDLKSKNMQLTQNLSDIISNFTSSSKKHKKDMKMKTRLIEIQIPKPIQIHEKFSETDSELHLLNTSQKYSQTDFITKESAVQTTLTIDQTLKHEDYFLNHDFISFYQIYIKDKASEKSTQTDKKAKFKELEDSQLLVKNLMRKTATAISKTFIKIRNKDEPSNEADLHRELLTKSVEPDKSTERNTETATAREIYNQELEIYTQFLGYKKLDFETLQKLWEEVINRRLLEGEKDQITSHLRSFFGTEAFEPEKHKVINILTSLKPDSSPRNLYSTFFKDLNTKLSTLSKWRKFLITFFKHHLSKILISPLIFSKLVFFFHLINKPLISPHKMKKSETFITFKNEDWRLNSKSPLPKQSNSRFFSKPTKTFEKLIRVKTPKPFKALHKLPSLNLLNK